MTMCLVFGGNGFIGSHLAEGLVQKGCRVRVFDSFLFGRGNLESIKNKIEIIEGDFLSEADVNNALRDVDYVFHYISTTVPPTAKKDPVFDIQSNVIGSVKLFQNCIDHKIKKVFFSSSGGTIYGEPATVPIRETDPLNPLDPYGISKLAIEKYLNYFGYAFGLDYVIFRYSNPYGERQNPNSKQGVIPVFLNKVKLGETPVIYGDGSSIRDYIYIKDAVGATLAVFENKTRERIFNVGSGSGKSLNELIATISAVIGKKIVPEYIEDTGKYIKRITLDISRIRKEVNWKPEVNLEEGIRRTWEWIKRI